MDRRQAPFSESYHRPGSRCRTCPSLLLALPLVLLRLSLPLPFEFLCFSLPLPLEFLCFSLLLPFGPLRRSRLLGSIALDRPGLGQS